MNHCSPRPASCPRPSRVRLSVEALEQRQLLSGSPLPLSHNPGVIPVAPPPSPAPGVLIVNLTPPAIHLSLPSPDLSGGALTQTIPPILLLPPLVDTVLTPGGGTGASAAGSGGSSTSTLPGTPVAQALVNPQPPPAANSAPGGPLKHRTVDAGPQALVPAGGFVKLGVRHHRRHPRHRPA
jgi:hypothetical protein